MQKFASTHPQMTSARKLYTPSGLVSAILPFDVNVYTGFNILQNKGKIYGKN